jgi:CVNH domain-containing protein
MRRLMMSWAIGLVWIGIHGTAMAQSVPSGSYQSSCRNISLQGDVLVANCQDADGKWEATQLRDYRSCGSDIMNDNGALRCGNTVNGAVPGYPGGYQSANQAGVPNGSYTQTCQEIRIKGDDLEARCQTAGGDWHKTKLDDFQKCTGDVANDNGTLRCVSGYPGGYRGVYTGAPAVPSYTQTCKDIKSHGDHLEARCKAINGDWRNTSLSDYRKCHGQIINDDGNLRCVAAASTVYPGTGPAGYAAGVPAGSYVQTCQEVRVSGDDLQARCQTANGDMRDSKLDDFQKCRGDIVNDDGHLRCSK